MNFKISDLKDPIEWPAMKICAQPKFKNKSLYSKFMGKGWTESFQSEEEFLQLEKELFFTDPNELIHAVTIADTYVNAIRRIKAGITLFYGLHSGRRG